jgi:osmoprotectant transport system ATP-binding protein
MYARRVIAWRAVEKSYGAARVLGPVTLEVAPGERLALVGTSGCGKSTMLRLALGLVGATAGSVVVADIPVEPARAREVRLRTGYVIQDGGLFPHLTCAENVELVAKREGWSAERRRKRVRELAELVRLPEDVLFRYPLEASGGQRQRVGIMRALMMDPDVLLLDEPMGALDPLVRAALQDDLVGLFERLGKTVVLVTHDVAEAAIVCGSIALMRRGEVVQRGSMKDLLESPADPFVEQFLRAQRGVPGLEAK